MTDLSYPGSIDRLAQGALSQMADYFSHDIQTPADVAMLEDRALGTAAKLVYFNTIRNELRMVASGDRKPAEGLRHLDRLGRAWVSKGSESRGAGKKGASMALALSDRWRNWVVGSPMAKERLGFIDHFNLPE